jgi:hypothetical protein
MYLSKVYNNKPLYCICIYHVCITMYYVLFATTKTVNVISQGWCKKHVLLINVDWIWIFIDLWQFSSLAVWHMSCTGLSHGFVYRQFANHFIFAPHEKCYSHSPLV